MNRDEILEVIAEELDAPGGASQRAVRKDRVGAGILAVVVLSVSIPLGLISWSDRAWMLLVLFSAMALLGVYLLVVAALGRGLLRPPNGAPPA